MTKSQRKRNIVLLTDCLAYLTGGAERQIFELARRLNKKKYSVTIASLECEGTAPREIIEANGCQLATFPVKRIYGISGLLQGLRFIRFLENQKVDILVTYHFSSDIWGAFFGRLAKVRTIISNRRDTGFWRKAHHIWAYRIINRWVHKVIVVAKAVSDVVCAQEKVPREKIEVIHNGIDLNHGQSENKGAPSKRKLNIKKDDIVMMHVANITPVKGHIFLFEAFKEIQNEHANIKLFVIGADEMDGALERLAKQLHIQRNVVFLGEREDVSQLLKLADICVLPSLSEGMSNAILEYMAAGKAVVATNVGGNSELIQDGFNGILVDKENKDDLKNALLDLINDPDRRTTMGQNGLQRVRNRFSMERMIKNYEHTFKTLLPAQKRILHLISSSGLFGAENIVLTLGINIQNQKYYSIIGALQNTVDSKVEVIEKASESGVETFTLKCFGRFDLGAVFRLKKYMVDNEIDILHTHNYKSDAIGFLASRVTGIPLVATAHGFTDMTHSVSAYEKLDRWLLGSFFNKVVVVTGKMIKNFPEGKHCVIENGVDVNKFSRDVQKGAALRKRYRIKEDDILIGTIGRLSGEKNQKMLLEAMYPLMRDNDSIKLIIAGSGPKEDELKQFSEARHLTDRIIFTGVMHDVVSVYSAINIFVLSSLTEGVPLTVLEAMASRLPVIATRVGGIPDMIENDKTGLLIDSHDTDDLRIKTENLINNQDKRNRLGESAFNFVKANYSLENMCDAYRKVYEEVLN